MKVREIMTKHVSSANMKDTIDQISRKMKELNVGTVPVCDDQNRVVGIVTDRDIVVRGIGDGYQASDNIESVMSKEPISISPESHVHEAARLMAQNQVRRDRKSVV